MRPKSWTTKLNINPKTSYVTNKNNMDEIRNENDYDKALKLCHSLMNAKIETDEANELIRLSKLIEKYENEHF